MSSTPTLKFAKDSSHELHNPRTLRALVALRNQEIAERIKQLREQRGNPPQPIVAAAIGVSLRAYQKYEAGDAKPQYRNLEALADYYGVTESYILEGVDTRPEVQGVPEQLTAVDGKFSDLVGAVVDQLERIEEKLDRLMRLANAGLFIQLHEDDDAPGEDRRHEEPLRGDRLSLGDLLAEAFQANPEALQALLSPHQEPQAPQAPARTAGERRSRRAG